MPPASQAERLFGGHPPCITHPKPLHIQLCLRRWHITILSRPPSPLDEITLHKTANVSRRRAPLQPALSDSALAPLAMTTPRTTLQPSLRGAWPRSNPVARPSLGWIASPGRARNDDFPADSQPPIGSSLLTAHYSFADKPYRKDDSQSPLGTGLLRRFAPRNDVFLTAHCSLLTALCIAFSFTLRYNCTYECFAAFQ
jgi:hypothetical protein